mgnify:CR=1 FL=1
MLSVIAHLTSLLFVVWTVYSIWQITYGEPDWWHFAGPALLGGATVLFFLMR